MKRCAWRSTVDAPRPPLYCIVLQQLAMVSTATAEVSGEWG
jgi:hypothetical protein